MKDYILDYIDYLKIVRKLSQESIKNYNYDLNKFYHYLKNKSQDNVKTIDVNIISDYLKSISNLNKSSVARDLTSIKNFF